jgi:hypothetical protein
MALAIYCVDLQAKNYCLKPVFEEHDGRDLIFRFGILVTK